MRGPANCRRVRRTTLQSLEAARTAQAAGRWEDVDAICRPIAETGQQPQALYMLAVAVGARGDFDQAAALLGRAIRLQPAVSEIHGQLGNVLRAQGKYQEAMACFDRALTLDPEDPDHYNNAGNVLRAMGKANEAAATYRKGLSFDSRHAALLINLGIVADELGQSQEAIDYCRRALAVQPDCVEALQNLANILRRTGAIHEALNVYEKLIGVRPDLAIAHLNLGTELQNHGRIEDALRCYRKVLSIKPDMALAHNNIASALRLQDKGADAIASLEKAIELDPGLMAARLNLGAALQAEKRYDEALAALERARELDPGNPEVYNSFGTVYSAQERFDRALEMYRRAEALKPDFAEVHSNIANVLRDQGNLLEATLGYKRALELKPEFPDALNNLANALKEQGDIAGSIAAYQRAIDLKPENSAFRWNQALALLSDGQLQSGWEGYEWGFPCKQRLPERKFPQPRWTGESLTGKTILTWGEQGVGDEIIFANCIPDLVYAADACIVECDHRLVPLFARSFPDCEVVAHMEEAHPRTRWPDIDVQAPMGNLPRWLRPAIESFPRRRSFLRADESRVAYWKQHLAALGSGIKVGISWCSRLMLASRRKHYVPLDQWDPILTVPGAHFVNLQYSSFEEDIADTRRRTEVSIHNFEDLNLKDALDDVAALISALDLVITICNVNMDLGGALGTETWLLAFRQGMTWATLGQDYSPWFPSIRMFARNWDETWQGAVQTAAAALRERCCA
jgi:tetratricopeptide (TPR) repeat protein